MSIVPLTPIQASNGRQPVAVNHKGLQNEVNNVALTINNTLMRFQLHIHQLHTLMASNLHDQCNECLILLENGQSHFNEYRDHFI